MKKIIVIHIEFYISWEKNGTVLLSNYAWDGLKYTFVLFQAKPPSF